MDTMTPVQSTPTLDQARLRPTPVERVPEKEDGQQKQLQPVEARLPAPVPTAESLEGRDLADPFQARRAQEQAVVAPPQELSGLEMGGEVIAPSAANDAAAEVATTELSPEPSQAASTPRSIARYQDVPRARADQVAATGGVETEPEPFAVDARDGLAQADSSSGADRSALERTNEDSVRRGSAAVAGAALSAAGEQLATAVDDRSLQAEPSPEPPVQNAGPDDGVEGPEKTVFQATLSGPEDVDPSSLGSEQAPSPR